MDIVINMGPHACIMVGLVAITIGIYKLSCRR
jgi:hypothetical protein